MEKKMADNTSSSITGRESHEAKSKAFNEKLEEQKKRLTGKADNKPDNKPDAGATGETAPTPPENGGNSEGSGTPDAGQNPPPPSQPDTPTEEYDTAMAFESNAYGLGKMAKEKKDPPAKHHSAPAKAPERKKDGYKPGSSSNFLQACYNEIVVAAYAGAIDLTVDLTLDIFDWILFGPLSSSKSSEKKPDKNKEKTVFDYADEMIAENTEKGKELVKSVLLHHKELMENVEAAQNGQKPKWRVWQGHEPQCFNHLVEIKNKADADPNSPEAGEWAEFKDIPRKAIETIARQTDVANFAVHHAALSINTTEVEPLPVEITKALKEMEEIITNPKLKDAEIKAGVVEKIKEVRAHTTADTPINSEINENLNKFSEALTIPGCNRKSMMEKLLVIKEIHPIKQKLKQDAATFGETIIKNLNLIDKEYETDPERANAEKDKYLQKINESQLEAAKRVKKDLNSIWLLRNYGIKNFGNTKENAQNAVQYAENTMCNVNVTENKRNQKKQKTILNDMDVRGFINQMGMKR
jgi:hypothetical protein